MELYTALSDIPADFGPSAVTIGKFDGMHIGHGSMVDQLMLDARKRSLVPTVLTFDRNPLSLLSPETCPDPLLSNQQKLELFESNGVEATVMLTFDKRLSELSADDFATTALAGALNAKLIFVGTDFRFGQGGYGTADLLQKFGAERGVDVRQFPAVELEGRRVSSTWVRELLLDGDVEGAAQLLRRPAVVRGTVVRGAQRGRELGFPTANLDQNLEGLIPADGVYAAWATLRPAGNSAGVPEATRIASAVSIGNNPTFDGVPPKQVEAHLLDTDRDLYGQTLQLEFMHRIRGMEKFDSLAPLIERIGKDVEEARHLLAAHPVGPSS